MNNEIKEIYKSKKANRAGYIIFAIAVSLAMIFAWSTLGYPRSIAEARFLSKLKSILPKNVEKIELTELMPDEWEMVCASNGYDEPLYLKKYNKTFPTAGAMQDGSWGLIFIKTDGTFDLVSSSCGQGTYIGFSGGICLSREKSSLSREKNPEHSKCRAFETTQQFKPASESN